MVRALRPLLGSVGFGERQDQLKNPADLLGPHTASRNSPSSPNSLSLSTTTTTTSSSFSSLPNRNPHSPTSATRQNRSPRQRAFPPDPSSLRTPPAYPAEHIAAEIIVRTDEAMAGDVMDAEPPAPSTSAARASLAPSPPLLQGASASGPAAAPSTSFSSSTPALSEHSELSSVPASLSSKATTPALGETAKDAGVSAGPRDPSIRAPSHILPGASIPSVKEVTREEFAQMCYDSASTCRLDGNALCSEEISLLEDHFSHPDVTNYLILRNRILRLWTANPRYAVMREEALGCATQEAWQDVAELCYDFLVRRGHINFGCCEITASRPRGSATARKQRTILVIGAGFSGLSTARQLEGLVAQYAGKFYSEGELPAKIIVLEARNRIGGRVFSREFISNDLPYQPKTIGSLIMRFAAEVGGMIVTGYLNGNPFNVVIRGQLGLPFHKLRPNLQLFDMDGKRIDTKVDNLCERLFNYILDRLSGYKFTMPTARTLKGVKERIQKGEEFTGSAPGTIRACEEAVDALPPMAKQATQQDKPEPKLKPQMIASVKAELMGWNLKDDVAHPNDISIRQIAREPGATLGSAGDAIIEKFQTIMDLDPVKMRTLNWNIANHEYASANNWSLQSLLLWDQDSGNEWRGEHSIVVGGYQAVARGLMHLPTPLDLRQNMEVTKVQYDPENPHGKAIVECANGESIEADHVVLTVPLGVLKHGSITFEPPLPDWKTGPIERIAFGTLNKVVVVYKKRFWPTDFDFYGVARGPPSSTDQKDHSADRGYLFQWIDITEPSGVPSLLAFIAGDAAYRAEQLTADQVIADATATLKAMFPSKVPATPLEAFATAWSSDPFARGSYSSAGPNMRPDDYEAMAKPVGNLFFAGEHTTGTHPATVHGAYLTGLRVAGQVLDTMIGSIRVPTPLIRQPIARSAAQSRSHASAADLEHAATASTPTPVSTPTRPVSLEEHKSRIKSVVGVKIGARPEMPKGIELRQDRGFEVFHHQRAQAMQFPSVDPQSITYGLKREITTKEWKKMDKQQRKEFDDEALKNKTSNDQLRATRQAEIAEWDRRAKAIEQAYAEEHSVTIQTEDDALPPRRTRKRGRLEESPAEPSSAPPSKK
ncbi:hypothetical protein GQ53DRAFT_703398 [Thozetella sp. PMI_491]|nr:hypothetical protein GQ53DRAFT_703398 [Thozetella sp. PMI_491]